MSDEDYTAGGANTSSHAPGKHRGPRFSWTAAYEASFFRSLCESVSLGLREGSTFKQEAWDRAIKALIHEHQAYASKNHLINKSDNARKKFRLWRGLREDPEFRYDRATRTVTAPDDTWKRHIEKEPLSRSLKGRSFDHEDFYEVLFPDVIGSGGQPKRLTKPRRKGPDALNGLDEQDAPGSAMMDLLTDATYANPTQTHHIPPPPAPPSSTTTPSTIAPSVTHHQQPQHHQPRPSSTSLPARSSIASSSALTPPEDPSLHTRKRFQAPDVNNSGNPASQQQDKRRRTTNASAAAHAHAATGAATSGYLDLTQPGPSSVSSNNLPPAPPLTLPSNNINGTNNPAAAAGAVGGVVLSAAAGSDGVMVLAEAIRSARARPGWSEQAVDIFFRDFSDEDMDLQLKIAEKALTDENKAMVFCKMPDALRKHWVRRLREVHNRMG
ncbi:Myb/SANT-like DNA-binding domain-containing protein [Lasiosphaeria hispida]|uniref:Myb/SANT-like DNA-binding domain-containing protein n=1 Tax=Lasiosphaeria hispida TaxID=260671 RepID=A0AAJ0HJX4_9PEZI|nr:Myb/SANT-like DNA-binding domain-containing protein [Lasiosphaeria hispida]